MTFYSGFSLKEEEALFSSYHDRGDFCVAGFSLGAIKAFEMVYESQKRVDKLQLFSPAFFQEEKIGFKTVQVRHFKKNKKQYLEHFFANICHPSDYAIKAYYHESPVEDLDLLLHYVWDREKLEDLKRRGIMIEVYLGEEDKIINTAKTKAFFQPFGQVIMIKNAGHILQRKNNG